MARSKVAFVRLAHIGFILINRGDFGLGRLCDDIRSFVVGGQGPRILARAWCLRNWLEIMRTGVEVLFGRCA